MKADLVETLYFRELEGRHQQDARVPVQVGVLALTGGLLAFYLRSFTPEATFLWTVFIVIAGAALVLFVLAIVWILLANIGHDYSRLPYPTAMRSHFESLRRYHQDNREAESDPDDDFSAYVQNAMIEATDYNTRTNLLRSARFYLANTFLAWGVVCSLLAGIPVIARAAFSPALPDLRVQLNVADGSSLLCIGEQADVRKGINRPGKAGSDRQHDAKTRHSAGPITSGEADRQSPTVGTAPETITAPELDLQGKSGAAPADINRRATKERQ